jgi:hypothetical protein
VQQAAKGGPLSGVGAEVKNLLRRIATPAAVALILSSAPAAAHAAFTALSAAPVTVSTYTIPAPASLGAQVTCSPSAKQVTATVSSYATVPRATAYTLTLTAPDGTATSTTTTQQTVALTKSFVPGSGKAYTLGVEARVGSWVGVPLTLSYTC